MTWHTYAMIALGLAIIYLVARWTTAIPSPLICIVVLTVIAIAFRMPLRIVADIGRLPGGLPSLASPNVPVAWGALALAMVGLLESMMTARVVDDLTETTGSRSQHGDRAEGGERALWL